MNKTARKNLQWQQQADRRKQLPDVRVHFNEIARAIQSGVPLASLEGRYEQKALNYAFARLAIQNPALLNSVIGGPGSRHTVLMDECIGYSMTHTIHKNVGLPQALFLLIGESKMKDPMVFHLAQQRQFSAIVTFDGQCKNRGDLCFLANEWYESEHEGRIPGVIVLPKSNSSGKVIEHYRREIIAYLDDGPRDILDLRQ